MSVFGRTIDALAKAVDNGEDPIDLIDASVGYHNLLKVRHEVARIADTANVDPLLSAGDKYAALRKFAPSV